MIAFARARYNECVIQCTQSGRTAHENYELLSVTHQAVHAVGKIAKALLVAERANQGEGRVKPCSAT